MAEPPDLNGIHLTLAVEKRAIQVYVAPASFLRAFDITFVKGDRLHISGSMTREVRRDTDVLTVRDEHGVQSGRRVCCTLISEFLRGTTSVGAVSQH